MAGRSGVRRGALSRLPVLSGSSGKAVFYIAVVLVGVVVVVGPDAMAWRSGFIAWSIPQPVDTLPPGDHLQMSYYLWLWEHALTTGSHLPWEDPFQFATADGVVRQPFGWPLILVSVPVSLLAGPVAAYNSLVVLAFVAAACSTAALSRSLGVSWAAASVAGFAFAFAPFRLVQATAHVNALLAFLLPLTLVFVERALHGDDRPARRAAWCAAATHVSLVAAGELHIAVFAAALVPGYVLLRLPGVEPGRLRTLVAPTIALVVGTATVAALQYTYVLRPSVAVGGRSRVEAAHFAPRFSDLWRRNVTWDMLERYAYPGMVILGLALIGGVLSIRRRERRLLALALLGVGVAVSLFALLPGDETHPVLQDLYYTVPLLSFSRVPGRILIVGSLCLAVTAGFAIDALRRTHLRRAFAALAMAAILLDAPAGLFSWNGAEATAVDDVADGSVVLHLPPFDAGHYGGSVYSFLLTRSEGPRLNGYSPFVTPAADAALREAASLADVPLDVCGWAAKVRGHGIELVAVHLQHFGDDRLQWHTDGGALVLALEEHRAFERRADEGGVVLFAVHEDRLVCSAG